MKLSTPKQEDGEWYRGISPQTLKKAGCYFDEEGWFTMPYLTISGNIWYAKRRNPDVNGRPKYLPDRKNHGVHLYNPFGFGPNVGEVWLVEGEIDALSLCDIGVNGAGYPGVAVAVEYTAEEINNWEPSSLGEGSSDQPGRFRREWYRLFEHATVVAAGEADVEEAKRAVRGIMRTWGTKALRFDPAEHGHKDINDWLQADREGLVNAVDDFRKSNGLA